MKNCPVCGGELYPYQGKGVWDDNFPNYTCRGCTRVWYGPMDGEDGWATRSTPVALKKKPEIGDKYTDVVKTMGGTIEVTREEADRLRAYYNEHQSIPSISVPDNVIKEQLAAYGVCYIYLDKGKNIILEPGKLMMVKPTDVVETPPLSKEAKAPNLVETLHKATHLGFRVCFYKEGYNGNYVSVKHLTKDLEGSGDNVAVSVLPDDHLTEGKLVDLINHLISKFPNK